MVRNPHERRNDRLPNKVEPTAYTITPASSRLGSTRNCRFLQQTIAIKLGRKKTQGVYDLATQTSTAQTPSPYYLAPANLTGRKKTFGFVMVFSEMKPPVRVSCSQSCRHPRGWCGVVRVSHQHPTFDRRKAFCFVFDIFKHAAPGRDAISRQPVQQHLTHRRAHS